MLGTLGVVLEVNKAKVKIMKKLLTVLALVPALAFGGMLAFADNQTDQSDKVEEESPKVYWTRKPIQCGPPEGLIDLVKGYGETPLLTANGLATMPSGSTKNVQIVFAVNPETGSWTLIEINDPEQACVLGSGEGYEVNKLPSKKQET